MWIVTRTTYKITWGIPNTLNAPFVSHDHETVVIGTAKTMKAGWELANKDIQNGYPVNTPTIKGITTTHHYYNVEKKQK